MFVSCCQGSFDLGESIVDDRQSVASIAIDGKRGAKKLQGRRNRGQVAEDETMERVRMQTLLDSFAKRATKGCPSTYLDGRRGARTDALYRIDRSLRHLTVLAKDDRRVVAECPIKDIQDIYLLSDGEECFPPEVVKRVKPDERDLLVMIVHGGGHEKTLGFCVLEESLESRDELLECMRLLTIYAEHAPQIDPHRLGVPASPGGRPTR